MANTRGFGFSPKELRLLLKMAILHSAELREAGHSCLLKATAAERRTVHAVDFLLMKNPPDPILQELHAARRRLLKEHGGVAGLAAFLRQEEAKSTWPIAKTSVRSKPDNPPDSAENRPAS